jgi:hypothetical protein
MFHTNILREGLSLQYTPLPSSEGHLVLPFSTDTVEPDRAIYPSLNNTPNKKFVLNHHIRLLSPWASVLHRSHLRTFQKAGQ